MKVFMPIITATVPEESHVGAMLNANFGCIYSADKKEFDVQPHSYDMNTIGNLLVGLKSKGINTIITNGMPLLSYMLCLEMGFNILKSKSCSAKENIELAEMEKLDFFTAQDTRVDNDCMGSCSSCSSHCSC